MKIPGFKSILWKRVWKFTGEEAGFSLLEGMAASVVLSIGIIAVAAMQDVVIKSNSNSDKISNATNVAEQKVEELRGLFFAQSEINSGIFNRTNSSQSAVAAKLAEINLGGHNAWPNCLKVNDLGQSDSNGSYCISWNITDLTSTIPCQIGNCLACTNTSAPSGLCSRQADVSVYFGKPFFAARKISVSTRYLELVPDQSIKAVP